METKDHLAEIYSLIDIEAALPELNPRDKGSYYELDCPKCGTSKRAYFYKGSSVILCNRRNECGKHTSLWDYVQGRGGISNADTLKKLAELAGYALPSLNPETQERIKTARERASLFEAVLDYFKAQLWTDEGRAVLEDLKGRGYTEQEVAGMELGLFPSPAKLKAYLVNTVNPVDTVYSLGLTVKGLGETHKLVIPYRDPAGRLKGFLIRAIDPKVKPKYLFSAGLEKDTLFNLHRARAGGRGEFILVEGYLDALIATERGLSGVVAIGGADLTQRQLETALHYGAKRFTLALDNDPAGQDGTERTLDLLDGQSIPGFVVALPQDYKDPDELIKARGIEPFKQLVERAESEGNWRAQRLLGKHDLTIAKERRAVLDQAIDTANGIDPINAQDLLDKVREAAGIGENLFEPYLAERRLRQDQERLRQGYQGLLRDGERLLADGKLEDVERLIEEQGRELRAKATTRTVRPYRLSDLQAEITQTAPGLRTGYPSLDRLVAIPQAAITIVAGRPSHGKTTALLNLMINMTRDYQDKTFVLFSYEEQRRQIGLKLLDILSGAVLDSARNLRELEDYLRAGKTDNEKIEQGKEELGKLLDTGRILLIEEPYTVEDLADTLTALSGQFSIGAVLIDYIQKVKIRGKFPTRQVELQRISERILETAKSLSLPVILGAQLGRDPNRTDKVRLDNLREAGDIEQDANLVLGLFNPAMEKAQAEGEWLKDPEVDLKVTVLKNRNGAVNEDMLLRFNRPLLTLSEPQGGSPWS